MVMEDKGQWEPWGHERDVSGRNKYIPSFLNVCPPAMTTPCDGGEGGTIGGGGGTIKTTTTNTELIVAAGCFNEGCRVNNESS
jgi:hypothetical protein